MLSKHILEYAEKLRKQRSSRLKSAKDTNDACWLTWEDVSQALPPPVPFMNPVFSILLSVKDNDMHENGKYSFKNQIGMKHDHFSTHSASSEQIDEEEEEEESVTSLHEGKSFGFSPTFSDVEEVVVGALSAIVTASSTIPRAENALEETKDNKNREDDLDFPNEGIKSRKPHAGKRLTGVSMEDQVVQDALARVLAVLDYNRAGPEELLSRFDKYLFLFSEEEEQRLDAILNAPSQPLTVYSSETKRYLDLKKEIAAECRNIEYFPLYSVNTTSFKAELCKQSQLLATKILNKVAQDNQLHCSEICDKFESMAEALSAVPENSEQLVNLAQTAAKAEKDIAVLHKEFYGRHGVRDKVMMLFEFDHELNADQVRLFHKAFVWPSQIKSFQEKYRQTFESVKGKLEDELEWRKDYFSKGLRTFELQLEGVKEFGGFLKVHDYVEF